MEEKTIKATTDAKRLDRFLSEAFPEQTRSFLKNAVLDGRVTKNGKPAKPADPVRAGDVVTLTVKPPRPLEILPQDLPLDIVYQDEDIAVINKAQGMVVHPAAGWEDGTLVNALLYHIRDLSGINGELRPGIVHRLDKDTSGLLVIAKNDAAHRSLAQQIKEKSARRFYRALLYDVLKEDEVTVDAPIGRDKKDRKKMAVNADGRSAQTIFRVIERYAHYTYVECELKTGRTHQIRVHARHIKHPVVGDAVYTARKAPFALNGQLLHAWKLVLAHPKTGEEMTFTAPLPQYFCAVLDRLEKKI